MTSLQPFQYGSQEVRTIVVNDEPAFITRDLLEALDLNRSSIALLDDDEKGVHSVYTHGGTQEMGYVTEAGMYSLVLKSRKPEAKAFKRWITHEVLPQIRRTGGYTMAPRSYAEALRALADVEERKELLEIEAKANAPKVLFADSVAASQSTILVGELAKILRGNGVNIGQNRLYEQLREDGFLINRRGSDWNMPTQKAMDLGLFRIKETSVTHSDGHITVSKTTKVTGKGQTYFVSRFLKEAA